MSLRRHWGRATPEVPASLDDVIRLMAPVTGGAAITGMASLAGGLANTNLRVAVAGRARPLVLRFHQREPAAGAREAAIAARIDLAPRVLHTADDDRLGAHSVLAWADGQRLETLPLADQAAMAGAIGRALAGIHAHRFPAPGFFGPALDIATPLPPGGAALTGYLRHCLVDGLGAARLGPALAADAVTCAEAHAHLLDRWDGPAVLVHGDFNGSNILVRDGAVSAVLDWEFAFANAPFIDFGNILRPPFGDLPGVEAAMARGYRQAGGTLPADWRRLSLLVDLLAWADFVNRPRVTDALVADAATMIRLIMRRIDGPAEIA